MKKIAYTMMVVVAALAIAGCHCSEKEGACCGTCKKEAVKKACCGTCKGAEKAKCECDKGGKCCGKCGEVKKEAVKKACCGTCGGAKKAAPAPAKPAAEKPKDHPAH